MIIIGERINASRKGIAEAIYHRNADFIRNEAVLQAEAGADYIEVNAGLSGEKEPEDLEWLVEIAQPAAERPLCIDTTSEIAAGRALKKHKGKAILNSITAEAERFSRFLPVIRKYGCGIVCLCIDEHGIPGTAEERKVIAVRLTARLAAAGISMADIYIDPLIYPISVTPDSALVALETIRLVRKEYPDIHITAGISNISFGLPGRKWLNQAFLIMAIHNGLDAPIVDPCDDATGKALCSAQALLAKDEYCLKYINYFRKRKAT